MFQMKSQLILMFLYHCVGDEFKVFTDFLKMLCFPSNLIHISAPIFLRLGNVSLGRFGIKNYLKLFCSKKNI